ncbi:uncharacterized protein LOC134529456 isoform X2 [Bacillus rossius redtenbacheri]|uniref:uncharacterized protein LOC134529456 isoform X2 n=1 Tax=Bacillus rossius redtenbacheri TaxID=93214 RepID=UPI002FDD5C7A
MVVTMASLKASAPNNSNDTQKSEFYSLADSPSDDMQNKLYFDSSDSLNIIRSVAMSANVALAVVDEVKHFIRVSSFKTESLLESGISTAADNSNIDVEQIEEEFVHENTSKQEHEHDYFCNLMSSCSFVLPSEDDDIVSAVVISKWDDVIGPQTVHAWLKINLIYDEGIILSEQAFRNSFSSKILSASDSAYSCVCSCGFSGVPAGSDQKRIEPLHDLYFCKKRLRVLKAIKYITSHTVNYSSGSIFISDKTTDRNISVFIVPELDLVALCVVFHLRDKERRIPYSVAFVASCRHYDTCLQLSHYCGHWLQESSFRIQELFLQCAESNKNFQVTKEVNDWMLEFGSRMASLGNLKMSALNPSFYSGVLDYHFLPYALTSHLQTFCCSVVSGSSVHFMNMLIAFLALFLDNNERACSSFAQPTFEHSFQFGLYLQGILTNKSLLQECNLLMYGKHLDPITSINIASDVALDPIRQSQNHWLYLAHLQNNLHEVAIVS